MSTCIVGMYRAYAYSTHTFCVVFEKLNVLVLLYSIQCSVFSYNNGPNGILSIGYTPYRLSGDNKFVGNTGTPLRVSVIRMYIHDCIIYSSPLAIFYT